VADSRSRWSRDGVWVVTSLAFRERERRDDISIGGCAAVDVGSNISLGQGVKAPAIYRLSCSCYVYICRLQLQQFCLSLPRLRPRGGGAAELLEKLPF
jgi:hypothetical protein